MAPAPRSALQLRYLPTGQLSSQLLQYLTPYRASSSADGNATSASSKAFIVEASASPSSSLAVSALAASSTSLDILVLQVTRSYVPSVPGSCACPSAVAS